MSYVLVMILISGFGLSVLQMDIFAYLIIILGIYGLFLVVKDIIDSYWLD